MLKKALTLLLAIALLAPVSAFAEATALPFGLKLGMNETQAEAAFAADPTLSAVKPDQQNDGNGTIEYSFEQITVPDTDLTAYNLNIQIDRSNSKQADRLTMISYNLTPTGNGIGDFRKLLTAFTKQYGTPDTDPFNDDGTAEYVEWGSLNADWTKDDLRISLNLSRMYEQSLSITYSSRINYDASDLQE